MTLEPPVLAAGYRLVAELLLHPEERDRWHVAALRRSVASGSPEVADRVDAFLTAPAAWSPEEYVDTLELSPPCPLYLGAYLFDEPSTCRDVGLSQRNTYMIELGAIYRHFGLELARGELPDFAPAVLEFLALSLERPGRDSAAMRERLLRRFVLPALLRFRAALERHGSPYVQLAAAAEILCEHELPHRASKALPVLSAAVARQETLP